MKRLKTVLASTAASVALLLGGGSLAEASVDCQLGTNAGLRYDKLHWDIGAGSAGPNVLSELTWRDALSVQVGLEGVCYVGRHLYIRADVDYGWVYDGVTIDSDYHSNNRIDEYSRSLSDTTGDFVADGTFGSGYVFYFDCDKLQIIPLGGVSFHAQKFRFRNGVQTVATNPGDLGPFSGLNSTYRALWTSGWLGLDASYCVTDRWKLAAGWESHWGAYDGRGHWNLRTDFLHDFKHTSNHVTGRTVYCNASYLITNCWSAGLAATWQRWGARDGNDRVYTTGGISDQPLNRVGWNSFSTVLSINFYL